MCRSRARARSGFGDRAAIRIGHAGKRLVGLVEKGLERVADMAIKKDFIGAGAEMGNVLKGCATCHAMFRFDKGTSKYIIGE